MVIIDWLAFTLKIKHLEYIQKEFGQFLINTKGLRGIGEVYITETGAMVGINRNQGFIHVVCSGKVCSLLNNIDDILKNIIERDGKITRIDLAIDDFVGFLDLEEIYNFLKNGWVTTRFKTFKRIKADEKHTDIIETNPDTGEKFYIYYSRVDSGRIKDLSCGTTIYVGSIKSTCFIRFYDKKAQMQDTEKKHWVRCEFVFRDERATEIVKNYVKGNLDIKGLFYYYLDFKEIGTSNRLYRCNTVNWWKDFLNTNVKEKITIQKPVTTIEKMQEWIKKQVAGSLTFLYDLYGFDFIEDVLNEGQEKIRNNVKYQKLMAGVKEWK